MYLRLGTLSHTKVFDSTVDLTFFVAVKICGYVRLV